MPTETAKVPEDSICEVSVNGVVMVRASMDAATTLLALSQGVNPLPLALRKIADELDARYSQ